MTRLDADADARPGATARRERLREFQTSLSERLQRAQTLPVASSRLGLQIGASRMLVDLAGAGEILAVPPITPVPLVRDWYRGLPAETVRAICDHGVVPPSRLVDDYPEALEAICLRALESEPDARYPTALEMRRELVAFVRSCALPHEPGEEMSRLMNDVFADRVTEKREILRRVRAGSEVSHVPAGEIDEGIELAQVPESTEVSASHTRTDVVAGAPRTSSRARRTLLLGGALITATTVASAGLVFERRAASAGAPPPALPLADPGPKSGETWVPDAPAALASPDPAPDPALAPPAVPAAAVATPAKAPSRPRPAATPLAVEEVALSA